MSSTRDTSISKNDSIDEVDSNHSFVHLQPGEHLIPAVIRQTGWDGFYSAADSDSGQQVSSYSPFKRATPAFYVDSRSSDEPVFIASYNPNSPQSGTESIDGSLLSLSLDSTRSEDDDNIDGLGVIVTTLLSETSLGSSELLKNRRQNLRGKALWYNRLARYEQFNILGFSTFEYVGKWYQNYWILMISSILFYAILGSINLAHVVTFQEYWTALDVVSLIMLIIFGYLLALADFITFLLSVIQKNNTRYFNEITGNTVRLQGVLEYDEIESMYRGISVLNPDLVRFILYLNHFWIINGLICSIGTTIWWAILFGGGRRPSSLITKIYIFAPLVLFVFLFIFRKPIITGLADTAYWPVDPAFEHGRFPIRACHEALPDDEPRLRQETQRMVRETKKLLTANMNMPNVISASYDARSDFSYLDKSRLSYADQANYLEMKSANQVYPSTSSETSDDYQEHNEIPHHDFYQVSSVDKATNDTKPVQRSSSHRALSLRDVV